MKEFEEKNKLQHVRFSEIEKQLYSLYSTLQECFQRVEQKEKEFQGQTAHLVDMELQRRLFLQDLQRQKEAFLHQLQMEEELYRKRLNEERLAMLADLQRQRQELLFEVERKQSQQLPTISPAPFVSIKLPFPTNDSFVESTAFSSSKLFQGTEQSLFQSFPMQEKGKSSSSVQKTNLSLPTAENSQGNIPTSFSPGPLFNELHRKNEELASLQRRLQETGKHLEQVAFKQKLVEKELGTVFPDQNIGLETSSLSGMGKKPPTKSSQSGVQGQTKSSQTPSSDKTDISDPAFQRFYFVLELHKCPTNCHLGYLQNQTKKIRPLLRIQHL